MSEHLSFGGQSAVDYCIECAVKHGQTIKVKAREAVQRAEADGPQTEGVKEKVRGVVEELTGMEDDTETVQNENVTGLNKAARELRKHIYGTQAEIGGAKIEDLREIKRAVDALVDEVYKVREEEEECPECVVTAEVEEKSDALDLGKYGSEVAEKRKQLLEQMKKDAEATDEWG